MLPIQRTHERTYKLYRRTDTARTRTHSHTHAHLSAALGFEPRDGDVVLTSLPDTTTAGLGTIQCGTGAMKNCRKAADPTQCAYSTQNASGVAVNMSCYQIGHGGAEYGECSWTRENAHNTVAMLRSCIACVCSSSLPPCETAIPLLRRLRGKQFLQPRLRHRACLVDQRRGGGGLSLGHGGSRYWRKRAGCARYARREGAAVSQSTTGSALESRLRL